MNLQKIKTGYNKAMETNRPPVAVIMENKGWGWLTTRRDEIISAVIDAGAISESAVAALGEEEAGYTIANEAWKYATSYRFDSTNPTKSFIKQW